MCWSKKTGSLERATDKIDCGDQTCPNLIFEWFPNFAVPLAVVARALSKKYVEVFVVLFVVFVLLIGRKFVLFAEVSEKPYYSQ